MKNLWPGIHNTMSTEALREELAATERYAATLALLQPDPLGASAHIAALAEYIDERDTLGLPDSEESYRSADHAKVVSICDRIRRDSWFVPAERS